MKWSIYCLVTLPVCNRIPNNLSISLTFINKVFVKSIFDKEILKIDLLRLLQMQCQDKSQWGNLAYQLIVWISHGQNTTLG